MIKVLLKFLTQGTDKSLGSKVLAVGAPAKVVMEKIGWSGRLVNHSDELKGLS